MKIINLIGTVLFLLLAMVNLKSQQPPAEKEDSFTTLVQQAVAAVVAQNPKTQGANIQVTMKIWADLTGHVMEVELVDSTGDLNLDIDLKNAILLEAKLPVPPANQAMPVTIKLDSGSGEGASKTEGGSQGKTYEERLKQAISDVVAQNPKTKAAVVQLQLKVWPGPNGEIDEVELINSTGDLNLDVDVKNAILLDTKLSEEPPEGLSQPVILSINVGSVDGQKAVDAAVKAWKGPLPKTLPTTVGAIGNNPPSQNVTINLINRLVQRGVLSKEDAADLIKQAEQDAENAKQQAAAQAAATAPPAGSEDAVSATYIPDNVKAEMRDQIKNDVMTQARDENWAAPNAFPSWVSRIQPTADIRVRYEYDHYPPGNDNVGAFTNFNAINTGSPYDTSSGNSNYPPLQNVDQNRQRMRLRLRFGAEADLSDGLMAGVRVGTGQDDSPVSENQTLGYSNNGQGGDFSKYAIWLDRAYLRYSTDQVPDFRLSGISGRFDNPFMSTPLTWANDIAFEGVSATGEYHGIDGVKPFLTGGVFPIYTTDYNFASNEPSKFKSEDKWLYAMQIGTEWKATDELTVKIAGAYYDFENIEGHLSSPYEQLSSADAGNTDDSRPSFAQNGNTYMALRDIIPVPGPASSGGNESGAINQYQYYGLSTAFREADLTGQIDYSHFDPFHISLRGEAVENLAFDKSAINQIAVNNRGSTDGSTIGGFVGGDYGYLVSLTVGHPFLTKLWDWNITSSYRYVESDATVDAFNDSDFGANMAGTNLEGYTIGGSVALSHNLWLTMQYMSADSIVGPNYQIDILQFDINAKF